MNEEVVVRYYFVGGGHIDCEYNFVINTKNVTNSQIIKESVMNVDKYY